MVQTKQPCQIVIETSHKYLDTSLKYYTDLLCEEKDENKRKELQENKIFIIIHMVKRITRAFMECLLCTYNVY